MILSEEEYKEYKNLQTGWSGEKAIREILKSKGADCFFQADLIAKINNAWYVVEVKKQELFTKGGGCPFDGHGLPRWQVESRVKFSKELGLIPLLFVVEMPSEKVYYQNINILEKGEKYLTGKKARIIYPIDNFILYTP